MTAARRWGPHAVAVLGALVVVWGQVLEARGTSVYVPTPPFVWRWDPQVHLLVLAALAAAGLAAWAAPRLLRAPTWAYGLGLLGVAAALRLALPAARGGTGRWDEVFDPERSFEAANEYLPALPALRYGAHLFLDRFAEVVPALPVHAAGHPPGLLLAMHALGVASPAGLAAWCIAAAIVAAPLTYALGRRVLEEPQARVAGLLMALSPGVTMFGVTSADAVFMALGLLAALALVASRGWGRALAGGAALAVASFFAWSLLAVGAWACVLELRRRGLRAAVGLGLACGALLVAGYGLLHAVTGFDPIGTLLGTEQVYRSGIAQGRPYWFWVLGSPTAFLVTLGLPVAWWALRAAAAGRSVALAVFAVVLVATLLGFTKAETERIWLFLAPFACLAAATTLPRERIGWVAAALLAQGLACELLFDSVW